jgi:hypothetical protein
MNLLSIYISSFPRYRTLLQSIPQIPLTARSLLIKQCQAQYDIMDPIPDPTPTLIRLLDNHPPIVIFENELTNGPMVLELRSFFSTLNVSVADPLESALVLDFLRGLPVKETDRIEFIEKGWVKEIILGYQAGRVPEVNFHPFFHNVADVIHPHLPPNPIALIRIRQKFRRMKETLLKYPPTFYPRSSHKNMSNSTRRDFEKYFGHGTLDQDPIFGQDDWQRIYNQHGIELEGACELRQKWYPSGAKPRTYAAMGGTSYKHCRHLQGFFTILANLFPPTNHITRLRPGRLHVSRQEDDPTDYLIYDLTSFTSNMVEQKNFCKSLADFMDGVIVYLVDEVDGLVERDLGELLREYNQHCVVGPSMSVERAPEHLQPPTTEFGHGTASLLGIFGNLMTCTIAHFLITAPTVDSVEDEENIAGDDGQICVRPDTKYFVFASISLVGSWEDSKTFWLGEEGAICLKRPILLTEAGIQLLENIVPPTLISCVAYFSGRNPDSRYNFTNLDDLSLTDRINIVGTDLLRCLRSIYRHGYDRLDIIYDLYDGFKRLGRRILDFDVELYAEKNIGMVFWPVDPRDYDFHAVDPMWIMLQCYSTHREMVVREYEEISPFALVYSGDEVKGNSTPRLTLLEKLNYVRKKPVFRHLDKFSVALELYNIFNGRLVTPMLYQYSCIKDIPDQFHFQ